MSLHQYYSTKNISIQKYNKVKSLIQTSCAMATNFGFEIAASRGIYGINMTKNKWKVRNHPYCCPLSALLLAQQPKISAPFKPYKQLDPFDRYSSWSYATISNYLKIPEDFILGFDYGFNNNGNEKFEEYINYELPSVFPRNNIKNMKNAQSGIKMGEWFRKNIATIE